MALLLIPSSDLPAQRDERDPEGPHLTRRKGGRLSPRLLPAALWNFPNEVSPPHPSSAHRAQGLLRGHLGCDSLAGNPSRWSQHQSRSPSLPLEIAPHSLPTAALRPRLHPPRDRPSHRLQGLPSRLSASLILLYRLLRSPRDTTRKTRSMSSSSAASSTASASRASVA
jgi:hypothetical protein